MSRIVLVANQKGGVGKSSIVTAVAGMAANPQRRVLVVDADQQANATVSDLGATGDRGKGLAMTLQWGTALEPVRDVRPGLDLIPGGPVLAGVAAMHATAAQTGIDLTRNLREALNALCEREKYSLVLVDSGPGDAVLLDALLGVARWLVVPTRDDDASLAGVELLAQRYLRARSEGALITLLGVVLFDANPRATARNARVLEDVDALLDGSGVRTFEAMIRSDRAAAVDLRSRHLTPKELVVAAEGAHRSRIANLRGVTTAAGERLWSRDPSGLANDYLQLTTELLQRLVAAELDGAAA